MTTCEKSTGSDRGHIYIKIWYIMLYINNNNQEEFQINHIAIHILIILCSRNPDQYKMFIHLVKCLNTLEICFFWFLVLFYFYTVCWCCCVCIILVPAEMNQPAAALKVATLNQRCSGITSDPATPNYWLIINRWNNNDLLFCAHRGFSIIADQDKW